MLPEEHHAERCNAGDANIRPHKALQHTLARVLKEAGAQVDIERHEPMLYTWERDKHEGWRIKEAIMDVTTDFPGNYSAHLIDVSVRTPHSTGTTGTDHHAGTAVEDGEADKYQRYGKEVLPLVFEVYGRLGPESIQTLRTLSTQRICSGSAGRGKRLRGGDNLKKPSFGRMLTENLMPSENKRNSIT